jgi:hypothetical protein
MCSVSQIEALEAKLKHERDQKNAMASQVRRWLLFGLHFSQLAEAQDRIKQLTQEVRMASLSRESPIILEEDESGSEIGYQTIASPRQPSPRQLSPQPHRRTSVSAAAPPLVIRHRTSTVSLVKRTSSQTVL